MPLEIEIKLKLDSHVPILKKLRTLRAKHLETVRETNIFFDRPDRSLRKANSGLRVRLTVPVSNQKSKIKNLKSKIPTALLTFKGPPAKKGLRSRNAYDLTLTPADQIIPLLKSLGFQRVLLFEKIRDSWILDNCHVELDMLPHFGRFLEIEGPSEMKVRSVQRKLNLQSLPQEKDSYSKMVGEYLLSALTPELLFSAR